ncbi:hypothetical protein SJI19_16735 [Acerihabitans sp. TG2]|uniref:hypothetical protein n=1 Tax=Acerihabitans sp. TG2 TaxID=3096008 RepID=UPI002B2248FB|nr:hypothetical protein [Acerihabitans sp. TG2]MEA9392172.1 hypothetical protein [Acerihabitans sp. TG2]
MSLNKYLSLSILILINSCSSFNSVAGHNDNEYRLSQAVTCQTNTTPDEFIDLLKSQHGGNLISGNQGAEEDGEFTVSNPVDIWGIKVRHFSFHKGSNEDGDFTEYRAIVPATSNTISAQSLAQIGNVPKIADGYFYKSVGNNDLFIRQYGDDIVVSCANDVRTTRKSINRFIRNVQEKTE